MVCIKLRLSIFVTLAVPAFGLPRAGTAFSFESHPRIFLPVEDRSMGGNNCDGGRVATA
jgi:hypothetical protein